MNTFDCGWYLSPAARRRVAMSGVVVVVILLIAFTFGYGSDALLAAGLALLTTAVAEGWKAVLRLRPQDS
ncbi:hypothetical protein [Amycolatopsis sp. cmx-8-4]|uniref:hypothetical protein n=1 Tax=Amycolatopsis sp. cmx-8-4 TaxID=2790947 RepID=UPI00397DAF62